MKETAILAFIAYTVAILIKNNGVPRSYSITHYLWKPFPLMLITWAIMAIGIYTEKPTVLTALAGIALIVVGFASNFKYGDSKHDGLEYWAHMIATYLTAGLALASIAYDFGLYWFAGAVFIAHVVIVFRLWRVKNHLFWAEVVAFTSFLAAFYIYL